MKKQRFSRKLTLVCELRRTFRSGSTAFFFVSEPQLEDEPRPTQRPLRKAIRSFLQPIVNDSLRTMISRHVHPLAWADHDIQRAILRKFSGLKNGRLGRRALHDAKTGYRRVRLYCLLPDRSGGRGISKNR